MTGLFFGEQEINEIRHRVAKHRWAWKILERIRLGLELDREELLSVEACPGKGRAPGTTFLELALCSSLFADWHRDAAENMLRHNQELRLWQGKSTFDFCLGFDFLDGLDGALRDYIHEHSLVPIGTHLMAQWRGGSNHQTTYNLALLCIGLLTQRADFIARFTSDPERGFPYHIANAVDADGFWYEQSHASYHLGTLDRFLKMRWITGRNGIDLGGDDVLRKMLDTIPVMALPGGVMPLIGDVSGQGGPPGIKAGVLEVAYAMYKTPWIGWMLNRMERNELWSLLIGQDIDTKATPVVQSQRFNATGLCVLKHGNGEDYWKGNGSGVTITFGPHGDWHGHAGKLGIEYRHNNRYLVRDHGHSGNYNHPIHRLWFMTTLAHSTVVLDGRNQSFTWTHDRPERERQETGLCHASLFRADVSACTISADFAYPGCRLRRTLFLTDRYLLDIFECNSTDGVEHTFDWVLHTGGTLQSDLPFTRGRIEDIIQQPAPPTSEGKVYSCGDAMPLAYDYIREVEVLQPRDRWDIDVMECRWAADLWKITGQAMRLTMLGEAGTTVYKGVCPAAANDVYDPVIVARRRARQTTYIALHVPGERKLNLECLHHEAGTIICRVSEEGALTDTLVKQDTSQPINVDGNTVTEKLEVFTQH